MNLFFQKRFPEENMTINLFSFFVKIGDIVVKIQRVGSCFICVGKTFWDSVSFTQNLLIFFWVGFRWDGLQGPEMGGMDPTSCHPKPQPTKLRIFFDASWLLYQNGNLKSLDIHVKRCVPFLALGRKGKFYHDSYSLTEWSCSSAQCVHCTVMCPSV